jgi:hypothetical protein
MASGLGYALDYCCTTDNACGSTFDTDPTQYCLERDQEGPLDATCPAENVFNFDHAGCCRPDGQCGLDYTYTGHGCISRADPFFTNESLEAIPCGDGTDGGSPPDGGDASDGG